MTVIKQEGDHAVIRYKDVVLATFGNSRPIPRHAHYIALDMLRKYKHKQDMMTWLKQAGDNLMKIQQIIGGE